MKRSSHCFCFSSSVHTHTQTLHTQTHTHTCSHVYLPVHVHARTHTNTPPLLGFPAASASPLPPFPTSSRYASTHLGMSYFKVTHTYTHMCVCVSHTHSLESVVGWIALGALRMITLPRSYLYKVQSWCERGCVGCELHRMWCEAPTLSVKCILVGVNGCVSGVNYISCGVNRRARTTGSCWPLKTSLHTSGAHANSCVCKRIGSSSMQHVY
jgi:hypothetical protein